MNLPSPVRQWLEEQGHGSVVGRDPVSGGCISDGAVLRTSSGASFFLKSNSSCPRDMFAREAEGLEALDVPGAPRVPRPLLHGEHYILMEDLAPARPADDYWLSLGGQLAGLHQHVNRRFGFHHDNYIGSTPQPNPWETDGVEFFGQHRLLFQADLARRRSLLTERDHTRVGRVVGRLADLIPDQPASLLHGDLWTGNAVTDDRGQPALIDPAAHYGWAEADLAMTTLFGSFPDTFYQAYLEVRPLEPGFRERFDVYNLYHLLNHLNLFGGGYLNSVRSILARFS